MSQPTIAYFLDNWFWSRLIFLQLLSNEIFTDSMALLYTFIPTLEIRSKIWPAFRLPGDRENVIAGGPVVIPVPDEVAAIPIVDEPDMILFPLLLLKG